VQIIPLDRELPEVWTIGPAVKALQLGQLVVVPTDTLYALCCHPFDRGAVAALYRAKGMHESQACSFACASLKQVGQVARAVTDGAFRFMRTHFPGPFTLLLKASHELPRQATGKRKTIGVRMPDHPVCQALVEALGMPLLVSSIPGWEDGEPVDPVEVARRLQVLPSAVLDQGPLLPEPSTVIDFTEDPPLLVRQGKGRLDGEIELAPDAVAERR
jgi:tRNA threonylcarbamoyl adenosine modification protein (Sua5/YciO/YrdC/YwlC family)